MDAIRDEFVASIRRADEYGGSLENRLRYPLEIFRAMCTVWPREMPMSVRISAHDWVGDAGVTPDEAVEIARAFVEAGIDLIDVSAGQVSRDEKPVYGRMFQAPFRPRSATIWVPPPWRDDHGAWRRPPCRWPRRRWRYGVWQ